MYTGIHHTRSIKKVEMEGAIREKWRFVGTTNDQNFHINLVTIGVLHQPHKVDKQSSPNSQYYA